MAEVKWIKIITDIFDDEKIVLMEKMPEGDAILVVWFKLLCLAGKTNNHGIMILSDKIPYTDEMLATIFRRPLNTVRLALKTFEAFGMIEILDNIITITNWDKHQNLDGMEKIREQNRLRKQNERKRKKLLCSNNSISHNSHVTRHGNVTECHGTDKEEDIDIDIDNKESIEKTDDKSSCPYSDIQNLYSSICKSFPKLTKLSDARKKAIKARLNSGYTVDDFKKLFEMSEGSTFLKGKNKRNWRATFDWLIKDANMAKVLDGNYADKKPQEETQSATYDISEYEDNPVFGSFER